MRVWRPDASCSAWQFSSAVIGAAAPISLGSFRVPPGLEGVLAYVSGGGPKGTTITDKFRDRMEIREDHAAGPVLRTLGNLVDPEEHGDFNTDAQRLAGFCSMRVNSALIPVFAAISQNRTYHVIAAGPSTFWTTVGLHGWAWNKGPGRFVFHQDPDLRYWKPDSSCLPFLFTCSNNLAEVGVFALPAGISGVIRGVEISGNTTFLQKNNGRLWISRIVLADPTLGTAPEEASAIDLTGAIGETLELNNAGANVPGFGLAIRIDTLPLCLKLQGGAAYSIGRGQVGTNIEISLFGWTWPDRADWEDAA